MSALTTMWLSARQVGAAVVLCLVIALVGACLSAPSLVPFYDDAGQGALPPQNDAGVVVDADAEDTSVTPEPDASPPDPLPPGCPPCIGLACVHCDDCAEAACAAGSVCCAVATGKDKKYKSMTCRDTTLAGTCP